MIVFGRAASKRTRSNAASRGASRCSMTSTTVAASYPARRLSRYIREPCINFSRSPCKFFSCQFPVAGTVPLYDRLFVWMRRQPAFAFAQEFLNLFLANPVVLLSIQYRHKHVEMIEQILQAESPRQGHRVVRSLPPLRKFLVERMMLRAHAVPQRLE